MEREIFYQLRSAYKVTLRRVNAQYPLSAGLIIEYVPLIFNGADVAPDRAEFDGNVNVTTALAPGARFVIAAGAESSGTDVARQKRYARARQIAIVLQLEANRPTDCGIGL